MLKPKILCLTLCTCLTVGLVGGTFAAEVDCDSTYCFQAQDFDGQEAVAGICITGLPDSSLAPSCWATGSCAPGISSPPSRSTK